MNGIPPLVPPPQAQVEFQFSPLPTQVQIGELLAPNGVKFVALTFSTPQGVNAFFLPATGIPEFVAHCQAAASGLHIAR